MIVAVPVAAELNVTEHDPLARVHVVGLNDPRLVVHVTVPVGVLAVPGEASATVAMQLLVCDVVIDPGVHTTVVVVALGLTVIVLLGVAAPARCIVSPL